MRQRRQTVEHPFGDHQARMGATRLSAEDAATSSLRAWRYYVLAYKMNRVMGIPWRWPLMAALSASPNPHKRLLRAARPKLLRIGAMRQSVSTHPRPIPTNSSFGPDVSFLGRNGSGRAAEFAASVETDPIVWTGRVLQAKCDGWRRLVLRFCIRPRELSVYAPGHHGYPRASDLILGKALRGRLGHQITDATARPFLHLLNLTRRPR